MKASKSYLYMYACRNLIKQLPIHYVKEYDLNYAFYIMLSVNKLNLRLQAKYKQQCDNAP